MSRIGQEQPLTDSEDRWGALEFSSSRRRTDGATSYVTASQSFSHVFLDLRYESSL